VGAAFSDQTLSNKKNNGPDITFRGIEAFKDQPIGTHFG